MASTKYAFIDEFGAFGFDFSNPGCSSHFIITAIVVNEDDLPIVADGIESVRKKYFQTGEMPQFILDDLEKVEFGEEVIIK